MIDARWPIEPRDLPAPRPWQASFQSGRVHYHDGPFLRALIVGPTAVGTGTAYATYVLDEGRPEDLDVPAFEERWLEPLELLRVRLVAPDAVPAGLTTTLTLSGFGFTSTDADLECVVFAPADAAEGVAFPAVPLSSSSISCDVTVDTDAITTALVAVGQSMDPQSMTTVTVYPTAVVSEVGSRAGAGNSVTRSTSSNGQAQ